MSKKWHPMLTICVFLLASCGGGSGEPESRIQGTWRGPLYQGVISCDDGTFIGAGGGSVTREVELLVIGGDEIDSFVQVVDEECVLEGVRTEEGFNVFPVSGCREHLVFLRFVLHDEDNRAGVSYQTSFEGVTPGESGTRCKISPSGPVTR